MPSPTVEIHRVRPNFEPRRFSAVMTVIRGHDIGRDYRLRKPEYVLGRDRRCDICIPEDTVSRTHARILVSYDDELEVYECRLVDEGSTNRVFVNGSEERDVMLQDGDKIQIGHTLLKFEILDSEDIKYHKEIQKKIKHDALTGLLTKESLYLALEHELARCRQFDIPLCVLMMDLDFFKLVNDSYGHLAGSDVLGQIGGLIAKNLRKTDVSARYGGEEFISYLNERKKEEARVAADHLRMKIAAAPIIFRDVSIPITISIGIAEFPSDGQTIEELVNKADQALYVAKGQGRNRVCLA